MAESNAQIVERAYARFKEVGSPEPSLVGPGFVWDMTHMASWPEQPLFEGREGMLKFLVRVGRVVGGLAHRARRDPRIADKVVAVLHQTGRSRGTGLQVEMTFAQVWTMQDGKYRRMEMYSDVAEALADAGVSS